MRNPVQQERNSNQFKKEISLPARVNVVNIVREVVSSRPVTMVAQPVWCTMVAQPYISASHPLLQNWHLGKKNL